MTARRDLLVALSLANLWFGRLWSEVFHAGNAYVLDVPLEDQVPALMLNVLLLAVVLWLGVTLARGSGRLWAMDVARFGFLLFVLARFHADELFSVSHLRWVGPVVRVGVPLLLAAAAVRKPRIVRACTALLLIVSPFLLVTFGQGAWRWLHRSPVPAPAVASAPLQPGAGTPAPRVLWITFDGLDKRLAFPERPAGLLLPEFDRLRAQSARARNAYSPSGLTLTSLPALISGRLVAEADATGASELWLTYNGSNRRVRWDSQPSLFTRARELGVRSALLGWYHPYCRVLAGQASLCMDQADPAAKFGLDDSLLGRMHTQFEYTAEEVLRIGRYRPFAARATLNKVRRRKLEQHKDFLTAATKIVADPSFGLVFLHFDLPHPPVIYDRQSGHYVTTEDRSYLDNLVLTDRVLGDVRRSMEAAGLWESAVVIVSSDHPWRPSVWRDLPQWTAEDSTVDPGTMDYRVPFLVKMPGQRQSLAYDRELNTVLTHDLVLAILRREVTSGVQVVGWLDQHRTSGRSHYMQLPD
ncbi:MAG: sulfatase-like hydrolase/transferase [Terriglobales bacterium]